MTRSLKNWFANLMSRVRTGRLAASLGVAAATFLPIAGAQAGTFTAGNLAVYRVGAGVTGQTNNSAQPVFIDEYTPTGTLVQSIALPTTASGDQLALTGRYIGTNNPRGLISLSTDGRYLMVPGYNSEVGTANVHSSAVSGTTNQRVVGRIDLDGNVDTSGGLGDLSGNFIGVASTDGTAIWALTGSINYGTYGGDTWTNIHGTTVRGIGIFDGQLYGTTTTGSNGTKVFQVGSGLPTSGPITPGALTGVVSPGGEPMMMALFDLNDEIDGLDVLYYSDAAADALRKFSKSAEGTWVSNGTVGAGSNDFTGLTGYVADGGVQLFLTGNNTQLFSKLDASGWNGTMVGGPSSIANAGSNVFFGRVALVPSVAVPEPCSVVLLVAGTVGLFLRRRGRLTT